jgi:hypothetical protein
MDQPELLEIFIRPLEQAGIGYLITGSVAAIFYGGPRLTHDVDIVVRLFPKDVFRFNTLYPADRFYCPPPEVLQIELHRQSFAHFNLIHHESGLKADFYPVVRDPMHTWALQARRRIIVSPCFEVWLAPAEYVIAKKLHYYREGGSRKHIEDILTMLLVSNEIIDRNLLEEKISYLGVQSQWQQVLEEEKSAER